jgi:4-hydroxy-tetrahydrodipicolinate synthase
MRVTELCVEVAAGRVPVIAGTGSNSTAEAISLTRHAKEAGADGALLVMPYYNKPTQDGMYAHFKAINNAADIPQIIYNIPGRSVVDMSVETMARLAKLPNIVGVKDATADLTRPTLTRIAIGTEFCQLTGEDGSALSFFAQGGNGCISVTANVAPHLCAAMYDAWDAGDAKAALDQHTRLMPLHKALFVESSPIPVKYAASLLGKCGEELRLPMSPPSKGTRTQVEAAMRGAGLLN